MARSSAQIVQKPWSYCNVLRDDGLSHGEYFEQRTRLWLLLPLLLTACAPPAPPPTLPAQLPPTPPPIASTAPALPAIDPAIVSVAAVSVPAGFKLDGDLAEWGSLLPPAPAPPRPRAPPAPPPPDINPRDAASHVAIAVNGEGVVIAAQLTSAARNGIWLGIGTEAPPVPDIGLYQRGGGVIAFNCDTDLGTGAPNPPEAIAACRALISAHADFTVAHEARFHRLFKIDSTGVHAAAKDGALTPIEGAGAVFKAGPAGASVEVSLPVSALPRLTSAPLRSLRFVARAATLPTPPAFDLATWVDLELAAPVAFEPLAEIRAKAWEMRYDRSSIEPPTMSYHPADPLHTESVYYSDREGKNTSQVVITEDVLYTKQATLGDIEVGYAVADGRSVAILQKGKVIDLVSLQGTPFGVVERDGGIHVLSYQTVTWSDNWVTTAAWYGIVVAADGAHREDVVTQESGNFSWDDVAEFHNKSLDAFGLRGTRTLLDTQKKEGVERTWRWDRAAKMYRSTRRTIPIARKP